MSRSSIPLRSVTLAFRVTAIVLTTAFIGTEVFGLKSLAFTAGDAAHNIGVVFAYWLGMLPNGFCLCALWVATNVFKRLGRGEAFNTAVIKGLRGVGFNLVLSAVSAIFILPSLRPMLQGLGHNVVFSFTFSADIENVTIGLIGLVLYLVAHQGTRVKTELEQFV